MFVSKNYKQLLLVSRQFNFLLDKGESVQSALAQLKSKLGDNNTEELELLEKLISDESSEFILPSTTGPMLTLSRLLQAVKQYGGDPLKFFGQFHKTFLNQDSIHTIRNYDTSGIMYYLISLILVASIVVSIYTIKVFPAINDFFIDSGATLPVYSNFIFTVFINWAGVLAVIIILLCSLFLYTAFKIKTTVENLEYFNSWILRLPGFKLIAQQFNLYLSLRFLQLAHHSGVKNEDAKTLITDLIQTSNSKLDHQLSIIYSKQHNNFINEPLVLADSLGNLQNEIEYQIELLYEKSIANFTHLKDTLSFSGIVFVALVIGGLILAMYQPIFMLGKVVGG